MYHCSEDLYVVFINAQSSGWWIRLRLRWRTPIKLLQRCSGREWTLRSVGYSSILLKHEQVLMINSILHSQCNVFCLLDCWTHPELMVDFLSQPQPCWRHWRQSESFTQAKNFQASDGQRWVKVEFMVRSIQTLDPFDTTEIPWIREALLRSVSVFACILWNWGPWSFHDAMLLEKKTNLLLQLVSKTIIHMIYFFLSARN